MAGVQRVHLNNLNINLKNAFIVGIIIAKNNPRIFGSKKRNGESRGVTSFTLRDSDVDTIYVDVWGSEYYVITFYERFLVGDVGKSFLCKSLGFIGILYECSLLKGIFLHFSRNIVTEDKRERGQ